MSRKRTRANGEGTVYQLPNGSWRGMFTAGHKPDGSLIRHSVQAPTKREAAELMQEKMVAARLEAPVSSDRETVARYLSRWLEDRARGSVRASTYRRYEDYLRSVIPYIGAYQLRELRPEHIQSAYRQMSDDYAPATLSRLRAVLHHAFEGAVEWDLIRRNPIKYADPPKVEKIDRTILSVADARVLFANSAGDRLQPLWVILATYGLRISEALALTWDDLSADMLIVRKGKTKAAARQIPLIPDVHAALDRRSAAQKREKMRNRDIWHESRLVFTTRTGKPLYAASVWRSFKQALAEAGLPDMRLHDLRRTAVAWLREAGVDADVVQVIIGHEQIATTIDIYGSVSRRRLDEAAQLLGRYLEAK